MIWPRKMKITTKEHMEDTQHEQTSLGEEQEKSLKNAKVKSRVLQDSNVVLQEIELLELESSEMLFFLSVSVSFCNPPWVLLLLFQNVVSTFA